MEEDKRKLPEILTMDFVICDNTVNRYGWRLLVEGIDMSGFLKNPVCCLQHATGLAPVGKWFNLRIEGTQLKGSVEFDRNDEDAVRLYWKYKDGYMSAVSLNILPKEESDDANLLLPGQKSSTVTKSELLEISLVTLPGNKNAVKLCTPDGKSYKLNMISKNTTMSKEEKTVDQLQQELAKSRQLNAESLVLRHKQRGVIKDGEIECLKVLALDNYSTVNKMLDARVTTDATDMESKMNDIISKLDVMITTHEEFIGTEPDTKSLKVAYNKLAKLKQMVTLATEYNNIL